MGDNMFKKKRKVNIETSPLQSYTVGKIKENRFGFIKLIIFFGFFIGIIYFLPEINVLIQKYINGVDVRNETPVNNVVPTNNTENNTIEENKVTETKYYFKDDNTIEVNNLKFSAIKLNNGKVSFAVENMLTTDTDIMTSNIFFEIYDEHDEVVKRYGLLGTMIN